MPCTKRVCFVLLMCGLVTTGITKNNKTQQQLSTVVVNSGLSSYVELNAVLASTQPNKNIISGTAYLKASNTDSGDRFGFSLAIAGDTMVIGAPKESSDASGIGGNQNNNNAMDSGAVYIFVAEAGVWQQQAYIKASNTGMGDQFGYAVDIAGNTLVVGAPGEASNAMGVNGNQANNMAFSAGAAYVFTRSGSTWSQQAYLKASNTNTGDQFGWDVAIDGETVAVGAPGEASDSMGVNGNQSSNTAASAGAVYAFTRSGSNWNQQAYLKASNSNADDLFGGSIALSKNTLIVGAEGEASDAIGVGGDQNDNSLATAGAAYVFTRSSNNWSQQAYLKASNTGGGDEFGGAVDIDVNTIVIGALGQDQDVNGQVATFAGAAYVFIRNGTNWAQQHYLKGFNTAASDQFGAAVAISNNHILIGANGEDSQATGINGNGGDNSFNNSGAAYLYIRTGEDWHQQDYIKATNTGFFDDFGSALGIDGGVIVSGAPREASNETGTGGNGNNNSAANSGAVYVYIDDLIFKDDYE